MRGRKRTQARRDRTGRQRQTPSTPPPMQSLDTAGQPGQVAGNADAERMDVLDTAPSEPIQPPSPDGAPEIQHQTVAPIDEDPEEARPSILDDLWDSDSEDSDLEEAEDSQGGAAAVRFVSAANAEQEQSAALEANADLDPFENLWREDRSESRVSKWKFSWWKCITEPMKEAANREVENLINQWMLYREAELPPQATALLGAKADVLKSRTLLTYFQHFKGLRNFFTLIGDYESLVILYGKNNLHFFPSMRWQSLAKYVLYKYGEKGQPLRYNDTDVKDVDGNVITCTGTWNAPKILEQFLAAVGALHVARGQRGDYRDVCPACCLQAQTDENFNGCQQHRGDARRWRCGEPKNEQRLLNTIKAIRIERAGYQEKGSTYLLPSEMHQIRDSLVNSSTLENLQLWVMFLLGTRLFLRSDELLNLKISNPRNPNSTDNCINWQITLVNDNGDVELLGFNIRGKSDHRPIVLTVWEEERVPKMDVIRPLLAYIHLARLRGGFLFPEHDELKRISSGAKMDGLGTKAMPYDTFLQLVKASFKPFVLH
ncbi:hypothetical protein HDU96_003694, partial [Phlyctochytrium bullatum]